MNDEKDTENQEKIKKLEIAQNKKIAEYESIRQEILQKITIYNVIVTVMLPIIVTIAIQLIVKDEAASAIRPLPLASPFILILVISFGLTYCKNSVAKLSAYIIVFFEKEELEWNWESRNRAFSLNKPAKLITKIFPRYACSLLAAIYFLAYLSYCITYDSFTKICCVAGVFIVIEFMIEYLSGSLDGAREFWIEEWEEYKDAEAMILSHEKNNKAKYKRWIKIKKKIRG